MSIIYLLLLLFRPVTRRSSLRFKVIHGHTSK